jgi:hypothetical protein
MDGQREGAGRTNGASDAGGEVVVTRNWAVKTLLSVLFGMTLLIMGCARGQTDTTPTTTAVEPTATSGPGATEPPVPANVAVVISPSSGPPGTEIQVTVTGFQPETEIDIGVGREGSEYDVVTSPRTDADGALTTQLAIPTYAEPEEQWVVVAATHDGATQATSNAFEVTAPQYAPQVTISPTSGPPGTEVQLTAEGFPPNDTVEVGLGREDSEYDVVDTLETTADGSLMTEVPIPKYAEIDERWVVVVVTGDMSVQAVSNVFQVTEAEYEPTVTISPQAGPPGTDVEVDARGFPPDTTVEIGIGRVDSEYDVIAQAQTDGEGRVVTRITIPDFVEPEDRWVIVVAAEEQRVQAISDEFDVTQAATPTPTRRSLFTRTNIYLIAIGDAGQSGDRIGCDDSVVPVEVEIEPTVAPLTAALNKLLVIEDREYGETGLYNVFHQSDLTLDDVRIVEGEAVIELSGTLTLGGVCDEPRVEAQLRYTALQYSTVDRVSILINGTPLDEVLQAPPPTPPSTGVFTRTNIYLIAVGDAGQSGEEIGCDDSVIPVEVEIEPTVAPLTTALNRLLAIEDREYGQSGLYNALYQSDLTLDDVRIVEGEAVIELSGTLTLGGVCDEPRVEAQLRKTALQYSTVDRVAIFVNGTPLDQLLGGDGD